MIELEKTFLAKNLPPNLKDCKSKEIIDVYIPKTSRHPTLRIRKNGDKYEATKKEPIQEGDASKQEEQTILLTEEEFNEFKNLDGKVAHKIRYYYPYKNKIAEIDVFQGPLKGLILVDFEFESEEEKEAFQTPDFCSNDITQEEFIAGGMICGKSYEDIEENLKRFNYLRL
tara:strand:- start:550 stop:1062 length:513 start_codon:yes stop_codon:yes gene_type:complete